MGFELCMNSEGSLKRLTKTKCSKKPGLLSVPTTVRRCAPLYAATLVILPYFTLIGLVRLLTEIIKVKYGNITSVATYT